MARQTSPSRPPADTEAAFLADYDVSAFDRPSVAVDVVLMTLADRRLRVALFRRDEHPFRGRWSLPGGFVRASESLDEAAARVLRHKAGLDHIFFEQLYTFGEPDRDPRTRVISVAYFALVDASRLQSSKLIDHGVLATIDSAPPHAASGRTVHDPSGTRLKLAFDHDHILHAATARLRGKLNYSPVGYQLLPAEFTLRALQDVHETVLGHKLNKDAFRRRMLATGELHPTGSLETQVDHRPAELYRFAAHSAV